MKKLNFQCWWGDCGNEIIIWFWGCNKSNSEGRPDVTFSKSLQTPVRLTKKHFQLIELCTSQEHAWRCLGQGCLTYKYAVYYHQFLERPVECNFLRVKNKSEDCKHLLSKSEVSPSSKNEYMSLLHKSCAKQEQPNLKGSQSAEYIEILAQIHCVLTFVDTCNWFWLVLTHTCAFAYFEKLASWLVG